VSLVNQPKVNLSKIQEVESTVEYVEDGIES